MMQKRTSPLKYAHFAGNPGFHSGSLQPALNNGREPASAGNWNLAGRVAGLVREGEHLAHRVHERRGVVPGCQRSIRLAMKVLSTGKLSPEMLQIHLQIFFYLQISRKWCERL